MKPTILYKIFPIALAVLGGLAIYQLLQSDVTSSLALRLPGADRKPQDTNEAEPAEFKGSLVRLDGIPSKLTGSWPRFRGTNFDAIASDETVFAESWPKEGPKPLWSIDVGEGYAGAAVLNGRVYIHDYDRKNKADVIRCLSLDDGKDIWRYSYPVDIKRNHGMSRTIPAVTEKYIVTMGPKCHVTCLDANTGELKWNTDLVRDYKATVPPWYAGQCPLIDDGKAIIAVGGESLLIAFDCETGKVLWKSPNPNGWKMTHSSIIPAEFFGKRMYIYCASGGAAGISAQDGSILWQTSNWNIRIANIPSPLPLDNGKIFFSGGYNSGSMMIELEQKDGQIAPKVLFKLSPDVFGSPQHTPIFYKGHIYGVRPDGQLVCLDTGGNIMWTSTNANKFGLGPYTIINGLIYVMDSEGTLSLVKAQPSSYIQLARAKVLEGPDSWGPMAFASGRLILRDLNKMICLDITKQ